MTIIYPKGSKDVEVSDKIAIFTESSCDVLYLIGNAEDGKYVFQQTVSAAEVVLTPGASVSKVRINAGSAATVYYEVGSDPVVSRKIVSEVASPATAGDSIQCESFVRSTIADTGTITVAQIRGQMLFQDTSGGNVAMTMPVATAVIAAFPELEVGNGIDLYVSSAHATNTTTIAGATGLTLVGSGASVNTGASYKLIKTAATTMDLVRVG